MHIHKLAIHEFSLAYISFMLCRFVHIAAGEARFGQRGDVQCILVLHKLQVCCT